VLRRIFTVRTMREVGNVGYYITRNYVVYAASGVARVIKSRRFIWAGQDRNKKCT
jgi:hypothetical protein